MINHSYSMSHNSLSHEQKISLGISENLIRLSIGLEHVDDLIADLNAGFVRLPTTNVE
ncbi:Methionine gamma-lyase [compost metagenome]